MVRRCDFVVYSRNGTPLMIVECKAPAVEIGQQAFDQASRYNQVHKAPYLLITNGKKHFCCKINKIKQSFEFLPEIPHFHAVTG
jgi:type I site-specific restriction endonuclease